MSLRDVGRDDDWVFAFPRSVLLYMPGGAGLQMAHADPLTRLTAVILATPDTNGLTRDLLAGLAIAVPGRHPDPPADDDERQVVSSCDAAADAVSAGTLLVMGLGHEVRVVSSPGIWPVTAASPARRTRLTCASSPAGAAPAP